MAPRVERVLGFGGARAPFAQGARRGSRAAVALALLALAGCPPPTAPTTPPVPVPATPTATTPPMAATVEPPHDRWLLPQPLRALPAEGSVWSIGDLPLHTPELAPGEGRELVRAHCSTCHSTSYITMQPAMTAAAWSGSVTKMVATHGATIPPDARESITRYLQSHYTPDSIAASWSAALTARPVAASAPADDAGARAYRASCAACHQPDGAGLQGAFPPLADGRLAALARASRDYPLRLALFGVQGEVPAPGGPLRSAMPSQAHLSDADLAAALSHVLARWPGDGPAVAPYTADDVRAARAGPSLTGEQVRAGRPARAP